ncbi:MAG: hypothetical protein KKB37_11970 [Alphaproteobacteria bacterium]|nr:hypothetical protein [Alphaproteobacteria bacterium]
MAESPKRTAEIVQGMIEDALASARDFDREPDAFAIKRQFDEMTEVVEEFAEWVEERDIHTLHALGVSMQENAQGHLIFSAEGRDDTFEVRPRADMAINAGGRVFLLNPGMPIMEEDVYEQVLQSILLWATPRNANRGGPVGRSKPH